MKTLTFTWASPSFLKIEAGHAVRVCDTRAWIALRKAGEEWEHSLVLLPQTRRHFFVAKPPWMGIMAEALCPPLGWPSDGSLRNSSVWGMAQLLSQPSPAGPLRPHPHPAASTGKLGSWATRSTHHLSLFPQEALHPPDLARKLAAFSWSSNNKDRAF